MGVVPAPEMDALARLDCARDCSRCCLSCDVRGRLLRGAVPEGRESEQIGHICWLCAVVDMRGNPIGKLGNRGGILLPTRKLTEVVCKKLQ